MKILPVPTDDTIDDDDARSMNEKEKEADDEEEFLPKEEAANEVDASGVQILFKEEEEETNACTATTTKRIVGGVILLLMVSLLLVFGGFATITTDASFSSSSSSNDWFRTFGTAKESADEKIETENATRTALLLQELQDRFHNKAPFSLRWNGTTLAARQFLHLHHMKTGGTSIDDWIKCGVDRLRQQSRRTIPYASIHECSESYYQQCTLPIEEGAKPNARTRTCQTQVRTAAVLSYCAPLHDLEAHFSWPLPDHLMTNHNNDSHSIQSEEPPPHAITILRHPVDRVWSMYRFQTKACYGCRPLLDIYNELDGGAGTTSAGNTSTTSTPLRPICRAQLLNHQTRNLLFAGQLPDVPTFDEHATEAIYNLQHRLTLIGLTEELPATAQMIQRLFPWLAEHWSAAEFDQSDNDKSAPATLNADRTCVLPHKNAAPTNNRCGPGGDTHLPLPDTPDAATAAAILQHNRLDLQVYRAAQRQFALQKQVLLGVE